jgi:transcriptional regulator with XRE-family HTH domain
VYLENEGIALGGITSWWSPITPVFPNWAFHVERGAASRRYWDRIPLGTDVVITHGPPYGTLDKRHILGSRFGCKDLIQAVLRVKPKLHVFGHIHGSYGQEVGPNGTRMVNCAVVDEEYVLTNAPIVVAVWCAKVLYEKWGNAVGIGPFASFFHRTQTTAARFAQRWYAYKQIFIMMTTFGNAVSEARKVLGLSQKELASQIKKEDGEAISPQYLNDIERDRRNAPSQALILEFARVLKLKPDYLFALAQAWPQDIVEEMGKSSPEEVQKAFSAFRRTLKGK